uniref:Uncharacterized protein n=1 Tax=Ciona intestinalis TaxID=7719 RepID=H2XZQ5_CIOIN
NVNATNLRCDEDCVAVPVNVDKYLSVELISAHKTKYNSHVIKTDVAPSRHRSINKLHSYKLLDC